MPINRFDGAKFQAGIAGNRDLQHIAALWWDITPWQRKKLYYFCRLQTLKIKTRRLWGRGQAVFALACVYALPALYCLWGFVPAFFKA
jgi:hypothetical protein